MAKLQKTVLLLAIVIAAARGNTRTSLIERMKTVSEDLQEIFEMVNSELKDADEKLTKAMNEIEALKSCRSQRPRSTFKLPDSKNDAYVHLFPEAPRTLTEFTIDFRFNISSASNNRRHFMVSYSIPGKDNYILITLGEIWIAHKSQQVLGIPLTTGTLRRYTVSWNGSIASIWVDDFRKQVEISEKSLSIKDGCFILGMEQDSPCGGFVANQRFTGTISDFRMLDKAMSPKEVDEYLISCKSNVQPVFSTPPRFDLIAGAEVQHDRCDTL